MHRPASSRRIEVQSDEVGVVQYGKDCWSCAANSNTQVGEATETVLVTGFIDTAIGFAPMLAQVNTNSEGRLA